MPRKTSPPRLHLRSRPGRGRYWVILDRGRELGTGCGEADRDRAEAALGAYIAAKYLPACKSSALSEILVADVLNVYLSEHAPSAVRPEWLAYTAGSALEWWGDKTLADIRRSNCDAYVRWRCAQRAGVSDQTARHDLKTLRAAIRYYHAEYGPLPALPVVTLPEKAPPRQDYWLTRDEVAARLRACRRLPRCRHVARVLLIGVYTGTRPGAILGLKWLPSTTGGWFDLESETLHRRAQGKAESNKRQPKARIHARLLPHLRRWQAADLALGITDVVHYQGARVAKLRRSWATVAGHAGQGTWDAAQGAWTCADGPHICRHTAATWQMQAGTDQLEAAGYLGMSPETMWEVYGHHHPDFQSAAATAGKRRR